MNRYRPRRQRKPSVLFGVHGKLYARIAIIAAALIVVLIIILSVTRSTSPALDSPEVSVIKKRGALLVGVRSDVPGFSDGDSGLEIELGKRLSAIIFPEKGEESALFVEMNARMLSAKLSDASIDIGICLAEKDANTSRYVYSDAYYKDDCVIAVKSGTSPKLSGATIGYITDSTLLSRMNSYAEENGFEYEKREFASYEMMLSALQNGEIDGALMTGTYLHMYASTYSVSAHPDAIGTIEYAMVCSSGTSPLIEIANDMLSEMRESGELDRLINQYIGG